MKKGIIIPTMSIKRFSLCLTNEPVSISIFPLTDLPMIVTLIIFPSIGKLLFQFTLKITKLYSVEKHKKINIFNY